MVQCGLEDESECKVLQVRLPAGTSCDFVLLEPEELVAGLSVFGTEPKG